MKNINLIRKIAWSFHKSTGYDWDDLFQEAACRYLEISKKYDPEKGQPSTFIWNCLVMHLRDYLWRQNQKTGHLCSIEEFPVDYPITADKLLEGLSEEAHQVLEFIMERPEMFDTLHPKEARQQLIKLMESNGIDLDLILNGMSELQLLFKTK